MTVATPHCTAINKRLREAIVDQLRACQTKEQLLAFETQFDQEANIGPLYLVICEFLHDRSISRALAAKTLKTLLDDREHQLNNQIPFLDL